MQDYCIFDMTFLKKSDILILYGYKEVLMRDFDYYKKQPKADTHNHLNLSMEYSDYKKWAGFEIPNFPRKMNGLDDMHVIIGQYPPCMYYCTTCNRSNRNVHNDCNKRQCCLY